MLKFFVAGMLSQTNLVLCIQFTWCPFFALRDSVTRFIEIF